MQRHVSPSAQLGLSIYNSDYKPRVSSNRSNCYRRLRRNRPHPDQNFLLPNSINDGIELQKSVRRAVREYLDQLFYSQESGHLSPDFQSKLQHRALHSASRVVPDCENYQPAHYRYAETPNREPPAANYCDSYQTKRPATAIQLEKSPPPHLQTESKRDRSLRISQGINKKDRITSAQPQPTRWQSIHQSDPGEKKLLSAVKSKRAISAPPVSHGYSSYKQATKPPNPPSEMYKPIQEKLTSWAQNANDYEKQVVYDLLKKAAKPDDAIPNTPPSVQEADYLLQGVGNGLPKNKSGCTEKSPSWSPYFHDLRRQQAKHRNTHSAPVKHMLNLVPDAAQMPARDQRIYRLKGRDHRVKGNPDDERELRKYLHRMARVTQTQNSKPDKKFLIAPMHSYPQNKGSASKDYKCDVSFFQSVRAPFKSHFVIHPDFTSENYTQKKRVSQMVSHFRY